MKIILGILIALAAPFLSAQQADDIPNFNGVWIAGGGGGGAPQGGMGAQGGMGMGAPAGRSRPQPTAAAQRAMDAYEDWDRYETQLAAHIAEVYESE